MCSVYNTSNMCSGYTSYIDPDMIASIDNLVKYREEVGIKAHNRYLFVRAAEGNLNCWLACSAEC